MKRVIVVLLSIFLYSCVTVKIPEKRLFINAKYDSYLKTHTQKDSLFNLAKQIIETNNNKITVQNNVVLTRSYFSLNDNINLEYFVFQPKIQKKVGVFFIGAGQTVLQYTDFLFELSEQTNAKIYLIHYRGYGNSDGKPSFEKQIADNQIFFEKIVQSEKQVDFVVGYSIGSIFATHSAVGNNIPQLYLFAPICDAKTVAKHLKRKYMKGLKILYRPFVRLKIDNTIAKIAPATKIKNYTGKLVIFHGQKDKTLPYSMGRKLYKIANTTDKYLYKIPKEGHSLIFKKKNWENLVNEIND